VAWLYNKASLHAVDAFFQKVRRRISLLERPIHSSANAGRVWNGYAAYNPATVQKLLDIFRVVHNFIDKRQTKQGGIKSVTNHARHTARVGASAVDVQRRYLFFSPVKWRQAAKNPSPQSNGTLLRLAYLRYGSSGARFGVRFINALSERLDFGVVCLNLPSFMRSLAVKSKNRNTSP
jgi:hypothetical protein